jgi:hypothetical protein
MKYKLKTQPPQSLVTEVQGYDDYCDTFVVAAGENISFDELTTVSLTTNPKWVDFLVWLRNKIVRLFGLITEMPDTSGIDKAKTIEPGCNVGFFNVLKRNGEDILMGNEDKHLDFVLSTYIFRNSSNERIFAITTKVKLKNTFGKAYFSCIKPFHSLILNSTMKRLNKYIKQSESFS